jgi:putative SOS response-associated peptidase YedK
MCTRYALRSPLELLQRLFGFSEQVELSPRYNIAPAQDLLSLFQDGSGERHAGWMRWGMKSGGENGASLPAIVNARAESADVTAGFREAAAERRAVVLADGFYEWRPEGQTRQPYYFELPDAQPFGMAALYDVGPDGRRHCALLTMDATSIVASVHDRMPVILPPAAVTTWLSAREPVARIIPLGRQAALRSRAVDTAVNDWRREGPQLLDPPRQQRLL